MKKIMISVLFATTAMVSNAQKSKVRSANNYIADKDYKRALSSIEEAVQNEDTKSSPDAWFTRGLIYLQVALDSTQKSVTPNALQEANTSFEKLMSIKPDFDPEQIKNAFYSCAILNFNNGSANYSAQEFGKAYDNFMKSANLLNTNSKKLFAGDLAATKMAGDAKFNAAYSAIYDKKEDVALPLLLELRPTKKDENLYLSIINIYQNQGKTKEMMEIVQKGRSLFPENKEIRNAELNYYIKSGKTEEVTNKLEEAIAKDPKNPELHTALCETYLRLAIPLDDKGTPIQPSPANYAALIEKTDKAFTAAKEYNKTPGFTYQNGFFYYTQASLLVKQMSKLGNTPADLKQTQTLKAQYMPLFSKSLPYFETVIAQLSGKADLPREDKVTLFNSLLGAREIYSRQDNKAKVDELNAKVEAAKAALK